VKNNSNKSKHSEILQKLKDHLKVLFQFDCTDLDFGIYRIMNYKRKEIEKFIEEDLIGLVEKEFERYKTQNQKELSEKIEEKRKEIQRLEKDLGEKILKNGEIEEKFRDRPFAKEYLELKRQIEDIDITESIQTQVFNDLYSFFSRYYEDGDFISKRRYSSKNYKYAIPYNGEEVKLYWANFDQYYIKTGEVFKDYEFNHKGWRFIFRTVLADVPVGNVKGSRRYFFLSQDEPIEISNNTCLIKFEYRPLTDEDLKQYPVKTKEDKEKTSGITQDDLNAILKDKILEQINTIEPKAILNEKQDEKTILEKHLHRFTRKITSDFFIHKDLKGFLERELDYFIKTEVLDIESFDTEKERYFDRHLTRAKVVKSIGNRTIEFLAQIEDFQKMLWEKKKFVLKTDYVITLDLIPEEFHKEILKNKEQLKEWEDLGFGEIKTRDNLNSKKLPVDTKYFSEEFKERLLEKLGEKGNIDDLLDGVLVKSENWQALNFLLEKYKEKVQTIYIDPPFNLGTNADFLYKTDYKDSSWITLLENRLSLAKKILNEKGSIFVRCDYNGNMFVRLLMNMIFGEENFRNEIGVRRFKKNVMEKEINKLPEGVDTIYIYSLTDKFKYIYPFKSKGEKREGFWRHMGDSSGQGSSKVFFGKELAPPNGKHWKYSQEKIDQMIESGTLILVCSNCDYKHDKTLGKWRGCPKCGADNPIPKYWVKEQEKEVLDSNWTDLYGYSTTWNFQTENSEILLKRVIESTSNEGDLVMDFFLGSGTTTAVAHKLKRKWLGVEMGDHFETVVLPRMKKVLFYDKSGISKEADVKEKYNEKTSGGFFKYHYLEQYEDTLHNIEFPQEEKAQRMLDLFTEDAKTEYLMKYMLKFETEGSPSLLNLTAFENPYEYKLKIISSGKGEEIVNVDLVETFNYLIGLKIGRYKFLKENGRKYTFVFGERNSRKTAIVWRPIQGINMEKDREIIDSELKELDPDEIFINGDSLVKDYKPIESEFKTLMEGV